MINKQTTVTRVHRPLMALLITVGAHSCPNAEAHHANVTSWGTLFFIFYFFFFLHVRCRRKKSKKKSKSKKSKKEVEERSRRKKSKEEVEERSRRKKSKKEVEERSRRRSRRKKSQVKHTFASKKINNSFLKQQQQQLALTPPTHTHTHYLHKFHRDPFSLLGNRQKIIGRVKLRHRVVVVQICGVKNNNKKIWEREAHEDMIRGVRFDASIKYSDVQKQKTWKKKETHHNLWWRIIETAMTTTGNVWMMWSPRTWMMLPIPVLFTKSEWASADALRKAANIAIELQNNGCSQPFRILKP